MRTPAPAALLPLSIALILSACSQSPATPQSLSGTVGVPTSLPTGTWTFTGDASQAGLIQILPDRVTVSTPGTYQLSSTQGTVLYTASGPVTGDLTLNEVSLNARGGWVELYNGTGRDLDLGAYQLRAPSRNASGQTSQATFPLPRQTMAAGQYLIVTARLDANATDNNEIVFVSNGTQVPAWTDRGEISLMQGTQVHDTVRFAPGLSASSGGTLGIQAVPSTQLSSITRQPSRTAALGQASASAQNWEQNALPSPGALNNDAGGLQASGLNAQATGDTDNDGIPDSYETATSSAYSGVYVYNLGARQNQRDLFLELDWMNSTSNFIQPQRAGIDKMVAAFTRAGYALHVDAGAAFSSTFSAANYNLGGGNQVNYGNCISVGWNTGSCYGILAYKYSSTGSVKNFATNRLNLFRYGLIGNSQQANGSNGSSGVAEINGNDFVVTMGGWNYINMTQVANQQGSTIMHEFGHTLGLRHGGFEDYNNKPNYYSIMNYIYTLAGLDDTASKLWQRSQYHYTACADLTYNNPCSTSFRMDYSYGQGGKMDEGYINETAGINRGSAWIDWNGDGYQQTSLRADVDYDGFISTGQYYLSDYNDWANIRPTFSYVDPNNSNTDAQAIHTLPRLDVVSNDVQPTITETNEQP